jgi:hypothetical protein
MCLVTEHPRCAALLHGGNRCRSAAIAGDEFCQHHAGLVAEYGVEALKQGKHLPARRTRVVQAAVTAEEAVTRTGNGDGVVDPASVRPRLAEAAAESLDDIRRVLVETATGANRYPWATVNCKHCGREGRYEITVPDNKVRLDAVQALLHEALGRPAQGRGASARVIAKDGTGDCFAFLGADEAGVRDAVRRRDCRRRKRREWSPASAVGLA